MATEIEIASPSISRWWRIVGRSLDEPGRWARSTPGACSSRRWSSNSAGSGRRRRWPSRSRSSRSPRRSSWRAGSRTGSGRSGSRSTGGLLVSLGFFMCSFTHEPGLALLLVRRGRRAGQRVRLRDADPGDGQVVPRPPGPGRRPGRRRLRRRLGDLRAALLELPDPAPSASPRRSASSAGSSSSMTIFGAFLLRNPPVGYRPEGWSRPDGDGLGDRLTILAGRNPPDADIPPDVGRLSRSARRRG